MLDSFKGWTKEIKNRSVDAISQNLGLFTSFMVLLILTVGWTLLNAPQYWYIPLIVVAVAFIVLALFLNALIVIAITATVVVLLMTASISYTIGSYVSPHVADTNLWFLSYFLSFSLCLAISSFAIRGRSKWKVSLFAIFASFIISNMVALSTGNVALASLCVLVTYLLSFGLLYLLHGKFSLLGSTSREMPLNLTSSNVTDNILSSSDKSEWLARAITDEDSGHYLVWKERAYLLIPLYLEEPFQSIGRRKRVVGYKDKNAGPWCFHQIFSRMPILRSKNARIMPVFLDLKDATSSKPKVIGLPIPDSKKNLPIGIMPASALLESGYKKDFLKDLDSAFSSYTSPITEKQKIALAEIGMTESSDLIQDAR